MSLNPKCYYNFDSEQCCIDGKYFNLLIPNRKSAEEIIELDKRFGTQKKYNKYYAHFETGVKILYDLLVDKKSFNLVFYCSSQNDIKTIKMLLLGFILKNTNNMEKATSLMDMNSWKDGKRIYNFIHILDYKPRNRNITPTHIIVTYIPTHIKKEDDKKIIETIDKIHSNTNVLNIWSYILGKWKKGGEYRKMFEKVNSPTRKLN